MFEACPIDEVRVIRDRYFDLIDKTIIINSIGWFPYLIPIILCVIFADHAKNAVKNAFTLPENDLNRIAPPLMAASVAA